MARAGRFLIYRGAGGVIPAQPIRLDSRLRGNDGEGAGWWGWAAGMAGVGRGKGGVGRGKGALGRGKGAQGFLDRVGGGC